MKPTEHTFYCAYADEDDFDRDYSIDILQCDQDDPPPRSTPSVTKLCSILCNLDMSYDSLPSFTASNGKRLKKFAFTVEMTPSGASNEFCLLYEGRRLASQDARIEFQ